jgi:DNA invertase Pin-like site-specific DNA recombinase
MIKAFAYLRVSGKSQVDGDGFPRQLEAIMLYAKANDIRIVNVFHEKAICGATELENRPALLALMEALEANGTKLVLIEKLDRLARDLMIQESIIADIRKRGFDLISVMEPDLLQTDPSRKMMRQMFCAIYEYDKAMIVLKLRGARQRKKAATGRCEGRKPYGSRIGEADVLGKMRMMRLSGMSFGRIAAELNSEGIVTRTAGKRWHGFSVNQILARC